ncbi:MAG: transcription termination/antitermination protein NusA [Acidobacteria bacterium]|nr:transcription termination/antitermination protein NusA [Acidobacteriota bacterium]
MSTSLLAQTIEQLSREKGIDPEIVVAALEDAMLVATRKYYRTEEDLQAEFDRETGTVNVFAVRTVVEQVTDANKEISLPEARRHDPKAAIGSQLRFPKATESLGRVAAQTAKQVIFQKVREAEREIVYGQFSGRVGELVNTTIKHVDGPEYIVDLGRTEGRLPRREQSRLEIYHVGERIRVVIRDVDRAAKGPQVIVSRADPMLVQRLFEMEVPEIYDGTVSIKAIAREAGERTKIAVQSRDKDVDPVGACVGMRGMRVQSIIRELRGEKIDIIEYAEDTVSFATNALSPAKVSRVCILDPTEKRLEVVVEDSQLSLAIGKKGQNVRLASKLIDWHIDIKSEEEKRQEIEAQISGALPAAGTPLAELAGVGDKTKEKISERGISTIEELAAMTPEQLMEIPGIGEKMVQKIAAAVKSYFEPETAATPPTGEAQTPAPVEAAPEGAEAAAPAEVPADKAEDTLE